MPEGKPRSGPANALFPADVTWKWQREPNCRAFGLRMATRLRSSPPSQQPLFSSFVRIREEPHRWLTTPLSRLKDAAPFYLPLLAYAALILIPAPVQNCRFLSTTELPKRQTASESWLNLLAVTRASCTCFVQIVAMCPRSLDAVPISQSRHAEKHRK